MIFKWNKHFNDNFNISNVCDEIVCFCQCWRSVFSAWCPRKSLDLLWSTSPPWPGRIKPSFKAFTTQLALNRDPLLDTTETWVSAKVYLVEGLTLNSFSPQCRLNGGFLSFAINLLINGIHITDSRFQYLTFKWSSYNTRDTLPCEVNV